MREGVIHDVLDRLSLFPFSALEDMGNGHLYHNFSLLSICLVAHSWLQGGGPWDGAQGPPGLLLGASPLLGMAWQERIW